MSVKKIEESQLTLLEEIPHRSKRGDRLGIYLCECGNIKCLEISLVEIGRKKTCGCSQNGMEIKEGHRYGYLVVLKELEPKEYNYHETKKKHRFFMCKCDCGNITEVPLSVLRSDNTKSCGCYRKKVIKKIKSTHGMSGTALHKRWKSILNRCYNENSHNYKDYGGRGIKVCEEWRYDFINFYNWSISNGYQKNLQVDRIDNDGDYDPSNCRFSNSKVQANNRRSNSIVIFNGDKMTLSLACDKVGLKYSLVWSRINKLGMTIEDALNPNRKKRSRWEQK